MQSRVFQGLNYSLGNEDCSVESELLPFDSDHVVGVAVGGCQLIPFLAKRPKVLSLVDVSEAQLSIAELRLRTLENLSYVEYLQFWGYPPYSCRGLENFRQKVANQLSFSTVETKNWVLLLLRSCSWQSPLYAGKWERRVIQLSQLYRFILGKQALGIFTCDTLQNQHEYLRTCFPSRRWRALVVTAASLATVYGALCHSEVPKEATGSAFFSQYRRIFNELLTKSLAKDNFFLQLILLGAVVSESAYPVEVCKSIFIKAKQWVSQCEIRFVHDDLIHHVENTQQKIDFLAFSNITSYFLGDLRESYLQRIKGHLNHGALVVIRNFLHKQNMLQTEGFESMTEDAKDIFARECTRIYSMMLFRRVEQL